MSIYQELKRRNVFRAAVAYIAATWVVLQAVDVVLNNIDAPVWIFQTILLVLVVDMIQGFTDPACPLGGEADAVIQTQLTSLSVDSLVVTGLTASGCVPATVVDGLQHDYRVVVPREAVGDRNPEAHKANLIDMNAKYADVLDLVEVLDQIPVVQSVV